MRVGPYRGFLVCDPAGIRHVLQDNQRNYHKSPLYDRLRDNLGNGLLTSEDTLWLRQRRLAQPAFHRQRLVEMADVMVGCTELMVTRWDGLASRGETHRPRLRNDGVDAGDHRPDDVQHRSRRGRRDRQPHMADHQSAHRRDVLVDEAGDGAAACRESALLARPARAGRGGLSNHRREARGPARGSGPAVHAAVGTR